MALVPTGPQLDSGPSSQTTRAARFLHLREGHLSSFFCFFFRLPCSVKSDQFDSRVSTVLYSMPPKKSSSASADVCSICCQAIPPKNESLLCAGRCQQRFHRYCASVPEHQYKALREKNMPFLCPACYREQRDGEVNELKSTVEALRIELLQLRELVREVREKVEGQGHNRTASANVEERPALTAARSGVGPPPKDPPGWKTILPRKSSKPRRPRDVIPSSNKPQREKVRAPGACKFWGTMKSCTAHTVSNTIAQLCPTV